MQELGTTKHRDEILSAHILVVEDEAVSRMMIRQIFKKEGFYNVWEAKNGKEALEMMDWVLPDLIISDIIMPEMDGFEFCRNIRKSSDSRIAMIPILIQTAVRTLKDRNLIFKAGASDYITKPIDAKEMLSRAMVHLEKEAIFKRLLKLNDTPQIETNSESNWYTKKSSEIINILIDQIEESRSHLIAAKDKAEQSDKLKTKFLTNVSHELKTPVHCIMNYAEVGFSDCENKDFSRVEEIFRDIFSNGNRLNVLVEDLIDISKIETGNMSVTPRSCSVHNILESAIKSTRAIADKKHLNVIIKGSDTEEIIIDENRLEQVLINILANAISFSPENGAITCNIKTSASNIIISIKDEGPGIPEENIKNIFEPFVYDRSEATDSEKGTGLGLAICKAILEVFHGKIIASNSTDGKGAVFEVTLPLPNPDSKDQGKITDLTNNNLRRKHV